jgi:SAM-dependent methyltransferase
MCKVCNLQMRAAADGARARAFEERFLGALNSAALVVMTSVGHRTGLFDALDGAPPLTSRALADRAGLDERYVREWLGAMVTGGVVETDEASGTYRLPAEHASVLTRGAASNMAVVAQYIPLIASVEDDIVDCFKNGGGVPYERFGRFHEVMAEESGQSVLPALQSHILPLMPGMTERLAKGIRVLDLGCGRGRALLMLARLYPNSRFVGLDLSQQAIGWARREAIAEDLGNVLFEAVDLSDFDRTAPEAAFDLVLTFDAIHDQAQPLAMLKGIRRALARDGVYMAQDIKGSSHHARDHEFPVATLAYTISCMHCMTVSLAQGGEGLGAMWGRETAERYFREAGFARVEVHELAHDVQNYYYVCRP